MPKKYHGVIPPIITPVDQHENVDEQGFRSLIERCVQGGLHGIFVAGTNGEALALTQHERNRAIRIALDQVNGRIPVLCGVMDSSTRRVIENIQALEQMGGTCAVITSIFYARHTSQDETLRHVEAIAKASSMDLILYNIPSMTGLALLPKTVMRIAEIDNVKGYKDSSPDYGGFLQILSKYRDTGFSCFQGVTAQAMSALLLGADGFVPALAPLFPELFVEAYQAGVRGDVVKARHYNALIAEASKILTCSTNLTAAAKYAIATLGLTSERMIAPQDGVAPPEAIRIREQVAHVWELYKAKEVHSHG
jgi:4-hydroxy-tetrahydrodipicolinate synthase